MAGSPSIAGLFTQRMVVGIAEFAVAKGSNTTISTYALGSCIGVVAFDPVAGAGGVLHFMLPDSGLSPEKAVERPAMFADSGVPLLFNALKGLGVSRAHLRVFLAGGACVLSGPDNFKIGSRNIAAVRKLINVYGFSIVGEQVGGLVNRSLHLSLETGVIELKEPNQRYKFQLS
jgi:chemotaxis protein CheD